MPLKYATYRSLLWLSNITISISYNSPWEVIQQCWVVQLNAFFFLWAFFISFLFVLFLSSIPKFHTHSLIPVASLYAKDLLWNLWSFEPSWLDNCGQFFKVLHSHSSRLLGEGKEVQFNQSLDQIAILSLCSTVSKFNFGRLMKGYFFLGIYCGVYTFSMIDILPHQLSDYDARRIETFRLEANHWQWNKISNCTSLVNYTLLHL